VSVAGFEAELEENTPLPLLVLPQGCSLQRLARETLEAHEVPYVVAHSASGVAGLQSALLAGLGVACLNVSAVPVGAQVCGSAQHLPVLPDVEFSLLPPRPGESQLVSAVREMLASQFS
jgi:DNA-binding transcriptional LysR family regulator